MAKKQSPKKPEPKPEPKIDPGEIPLPANAPPENVKIGPLDPPDPSAGGGATSTGKEPRQT